jgi:hypothetical protein
VDDQDDRGYSRAPELGDLLSLCKALNAEGVRYALIGGFAVILHGFVRATKDVDLLIDASVENVRRLKRAMARAAGQRDRAHRRRRGRKVSGRENRRRDRRRSPEGRVRRRLRYARAAEGGIALF